MGTTTFSTSNHSPAVASTQTVDFMQAVPHLIDRSTLKIRKTNSDNGEIFNAGDIVSSEEQTVYVELGTNTRWGVRALRAGESTADTRTYSSLLPWNIQRQAFTVSGNISFYQKDLSFNLYDYNETRNGVLHMGTSDSEPFLVLKQDPFYWVELVPDPAFDDPDYKVPYTGGTYEFKLQGYFPANDLNAGGISKPAVLMVHSLSEFWPYAGMPPSGNSVTMGWVMNQAVNPGEYISIVLNIPARSANTERVYEIFYGFSDQLLLDPIEWFSYEIIQEGRP